MTQLLLVPLLPHGLCHCYHVIVHGLGHGVEGARQLHLGHVSPLLLQRPCKQLLIVHSNRNNVSYSVNNIILISGL